MVFKGEERHGKDVIFMVKQLQEKSLEYHGDLGVSLTLRKHLIEYPGTHMNQWVVLGKVDVPAKFDRILRNFPRVLVSTRICLNDGDCMDNL